MAKKKPAGYRFGPGDQDVTPGFSDGQSRAAAKRRAAPRPPPKVGTNPVGAMPKGPGPGGTGGGLPWGRPPVGTNPVPPKGTPYTTGPDGVKYGGGLPWQKPKGQNTTGQGMNERGPGIPAGPARSTTPGRGPGITTGPARPTSKVARKRKPVPKKPIKKAPRPPRRTY